MNNKDNCADSYNKGFRYVETTAIGHELMNATLANPVSVIEIAGSDVEMSTNVEFNSFVLDVSNIKLTPIQHCFMSVIYTMYKQGIKEFTINIFMNELARRTVSFDKSNALIGAAAVKRIMKSDAQQSIEANCPERLESNIIRYNEEEQTHSNFKNNYDVLMAIDDALCPESQEQLDLYNSVLYELIKMSLVSITLNLEKYNIQWHSKRYRKLTSYGQLLPLKIETIEDLHTHKKKIVFTITGMPILYDYAEQANRIAKIPNKVLAVKSARNQNDMALTQIIDTKISKMRNMNNNYKSRKISYEYYAWEKDPATGKRVKVRKGLFEEIGVCEEQYSTKSAWSKKKRKIHEQVGAILQNAVDNNYIKGFEERKDGQSLLGYQIIL
ncbi:MAG: hypothetical protein UIM53_03160 [Acutalibacteraceae bacterium]|nr:hypothetical protein [Acutalibacteraceae bacterium]